jgi:hypothetical protein
MNWESEPTDLYSKIPVVADTAALSALFVSPDDDCLDAVQLHRTALMRCT